MQCSSSDFEKALKTTEVSKYATSETLRNSSATFGMCIADGVLEKLSFSSEKGYDCLQKATSQHVQDIQKRADAIRSGSIYENSE